MAGNMYKDVVTWNPLGGECPHKCTYCSTNSMKKRYEAVRNKYSGPLCLYRGLPPYTGKTIFVCAQNDLFASEVNSIWIQDVLSRCRAKDNTYFFQTKNPVRYSNFIEYFPDRSIFCTTIETNRVYPQMGHTVPPSIRAFEMAEFQQMSYRDTGWEFRLTIEPIMDFDLEEFIDIINLCKPDSVYIGADSKGNNLPEPSKGKLLELINWLRKFTNIERKSNLERLLK